MHSVKEVMPNTSCPLIASTHVIKGMIRMKLHKTKIDDEVYYYFLKSGSKRFMYRHKYYDSLGKRREKKKSSFKSEKSALKELLEVKAALLSGQSRHIEHSQMTVSQWLDIWYETKNRTWEISTKKSNMNSIRHLKRLIGNRKISTLSRSAYEREFINKMLDEDFEPQSVKGYHEALITALNSAVEDEILIKNKFSGIKFDIHKELDNFLAPDELNTFLNAVEKYGNLTEYTLTLLLTYTGFRKGEAHGLKWENVDFENNTLTVERTRDDQGTRTPKTKNSYRTIEVDNLVIAQLKKYQKWCIEIKLSQGLQLDKVKDYVFISENHIEGVYAAYINLFFDRVYKELKLNDVKLKRITPHGLRHTHATILIDELVPPTDVADRLGNTLEMIYRVYAHSFKKIENKTVIAFGNRLMGEAK